MYRSKLKSPNKIFPGLHDFLLFWFLRVIPLSVWTHTQTSFLSKNVLSVRLHCLALSEIPYEFVPRAREWQNDAMTSKATTNNVLYTHVVILGREERANRGSLSPNDSVDDIFSNFVSHRSHIYPWFLKTNWSFISLCVTLLSRRNLRNEQCSRRATFSSGDTRNDHSCWLGHYVGVKYQLAFSW